MSNRQDFAIAGRAIGPDHPPYVIAEMSANHLGDYDRAVRIVHAAAEAGVDALKLQTYKADTITLDAHGEGFDIVGGHWAGQSLHALYDKAMTPWEWHKPLFELGRELGLTVFSSPFDNTAVDLLESLDAPAYKIASFELIDLDLIARCAATGKPVIMSTGNADMEEIGEALEAARSAGNGGVALLHCVSGYPTPYEEINLQRLQYLAKKFDVQIGLSDHTMGTVIPSAATALGATIIEKHMTLARADGGPDGFFSLEPAEFASLKKDTEAVWQAMRRLDLEPQPSELLHRNARRSLYVAAPVKAGALLTRENIRSVRPGLGMKPKHLPEVLGKRAARDLEYGQPLAWDMIET